MRSLTLGVSPLPALALLLALLSPLSAHAQGGGFGLGPAQGTAFAGTAGASLTADPLVLDDGAGNVTYLSAPSDGALYVGLSDGGRTGDVYAAGLYGPGSEQLLVSAGAAQTMRMTSPGGNVYIDSNGSGGDATVIVGTNSSTVRVNNFENGANDFAMSSAGLSIANDFKIQWSTDATDFGTKVLALAYDSAAGALKVYDPSASADGIVRIYDSEGDDWGGLSCINNSIVDLYINETASYRFSTAYLQKLSATAWGTDATPAIMTSGDTDTGLVWDGGDAWGVSTGGTRALTLDASQVTHVRSLLVRAQVGGIEHDGTTSIRQWGLYETGAASATGTASASNDESGNYIVYTSGATTGDEAGYRSTLGVQVNSQFSSVHKFAISSTSDVRVFVGQSDAANLTTMTGADDPAEEYVGIRYSTDASDTTWVFVCDDGSTQSTHASTESITTEPYTLEIVWADAAASVTLYLYDRDGDLLDSHTFSSDLPAGTIGMKLHSSLETRTTAAKAISIYRNAGQILGS